MKTFFTVTAILMTIGLGFVLISISNTATGGEETIRRVILAIGAYFVLLLPCVFFAGVIDRLDQLIGLARRERRRKGARS